jgi:hypothetical protein
MRILRDIFNNLWVRIWEKVWRSLHNEILSRGETTGMATYDTFVRNVILCVLKILIDNDNGENS